MKSPVHARRQPSPGRRPTTGPIGIRGVATSERIRNLLHRPRLQPKVTVESPRPESEVLRRWARTGDTAVSDHNGDTLWDLAKSITGKGLDWMCIRPVAMKSKLAKGSRYPYYVRIGDEFDVSNLTATSGTSLQVFLFDASTEPKDAALAQLFYPGSVQSSGDVDTDIETAASFGATPIGTFLIFGHSAGGEMWGDAASFEPRNFRVNRPDPTFEQAEAGLFPRRCWFTRSAAARSVGCSSNAFGRDFARAYLRAGASIVTTTESVLPRCNGPRIDFSQTPPGCTSYNGVAFADSPAATATVLEGPFWNRADFHAGTHWLTIDGKN
jgi:hypothetical protein